MKKYIVELRITTELSECVYAWDDYIEADSEEEAIGIAKGWLEELVQENIDDEKQEEEMKKINQGIWSAEEWEKE